ncbi:MAG: RNA polymerase factor sigma-54 [Alphaproteobacteria bacterium]|nr:RNA polymerase factor sigma-54 [Alphaproteobacteria bacterium]
MAIGPRLDLRQSQSLVMTPQLQQAIKLLQLSNLEVTAFVEHELEQNPLLEREEGDRESDGTEREAALASTEDRTPNEPALLDSVDSSQPAATEAPLDTDFENVWSADNAAGGGAEPQSSFADWGAGGKRGFDDSEFGIEQTLTRDETLRDHVEAQINVDIHEPADRLIALQLLDLLDEAGYLTGETLEVAERLQCPVERVDGVLARLQRFDPAGIFARNLSECLALQLRDRNRFDPAMQALIENLDLLARRDIPRLLGVCGVGADDLADMVNEIKALNPKPGLIFDSTVAQTVVPDVLMRPAPSGEWLVELNPDTLPRVLVNQRYHAVVSSAARSKTDREFIAERLQAANWLVKSLHQRAQTILKVATEIVRQQDAFFRHGVQHLRPLVLRDVATAISMHESTVSRVTTNKYLACSHGVFELKYFFSAAIASASGGEAHAAEAVRFRIKALIDQEPSAEVLSDDRIVEILRTDGIDIARRTVAKYREAMGIPSSVQRRREKSLGA